MMGPYPLYYYIPWPDSQRWASLDEDDAYTFPADEGALLVNKEWADEMRNVFEL